MNEFSQNLKIENFHKAMELRASLESANFDKLKLDEIKVNTVQLYKK